MFPRATNFISTHRPCKECKHFIKTGRCKLFLQSVPYGLHTYTKVEYAREYVFLCGPEGLYFSDKSIVDQLR